jgi:hypothetical protein
MDWKGSGGKGLSPTVRHTQSFVWLEKNYSKPQDSGSPGPDSSHGPAA